MCHEFDIFVKSLIYQKVIFRYNAFNKCGVILGKTKKREGGFFKMKKRAVSILLIAAMAASMATGCGKSSGSGSSAATDGEEGKVINIYSWNDEFRERVEAVYPEVKETSSDGTVTTLNDGTEIHWIINPNQDGVYQQKLDEALMKQADAAADDKVDIFLSETDYVNK